MDKGLEPGCCHFLHFIIITLNLSLQNAELSRDRILKGDDPSRVIFLSLSTLRLHSHSERINLKGFFVSPCTWTPTLGYLLRYSSYYETAAVMSAQLLFGET